MESDHRQTGGPGQVALLRRSDRLDAAGRVLALLTAAVVLAAAALTALNLWHRARPLPIARVRCLAATELVLAPAGTPDRHPQLMHPAVALRHDPHLPPLPAGMLVFQGPDGPSPGHSSRRP